MASPPARPKNDKMYYISAVHDSKDLPEEMRYKMLFQLGKDEEMLKRFMAYYDVHPTEECIADFYDLENKFNGIPLPHPSHPPHAFPSSIALIALISLIPFILNSHLYFISCLLLLCSLRSSSQRHLILLSSQTSDWARHSLGTMGPFCFNSVWCFPWC